MSKVSKQQLANGLKSSVNAICVLGGLAGVGFGCWQIYEPSAYIVVGAAFVWMGLPDK